MSSEGNITVIESFSADDTHALGVTLGQQAKPGDHFDVYRIGDIEEMDEIGYEDYFYGDGLTMIEWANLIEEILPKKRKEITIEKDLEKGFDYRKITIKEVL